MYIRSKRTFEIESVFIRYPLETYMSTNSIDVKSALVELAASSKKATNRAIEITSP